MATSNLPLDPTSEEAFALFEAVEAIFPSKTVGNDKWYILTVFSFGFATQYWF